MDLVKMGKFIATKRKEKKLTQKELADMFNIGDKAVSKWERGENAPDISNLNKLADILEVNVSDILNGEECQNDVNVDAIKYYNRKTKHKYLKILVVIVTLLVTTFCVIYTINNYDKFRVYSIKSSSDSFMVNGYAIMSKNRNILFINNIEYLDSSIGTNNELEISKMKMTFNFADETLYTISETMIEPNNISNSLENKFIFFDDYSANNEKVIPTNLDDCYIKINCININNQQEDFIINLELDEKISNNKLFY